ncbi:(2Fe-2S)-binding protein [Flavimarina sp. Hel_I_48]|uniref:(2Fe-2S)-binding protein n=1 Tax=Flavimarina sp. Hel_I_48 TaxID=1392488 RepID=UPI0004DF0C3D|nr:(2Fe-2S)-binding protein [Flavimarina sp. Hel_I_48]
MKTSIALDVNGEEKEINVSPDTPLLYVLRNNLQLNGPKFGCGLEQCGACFVLLDGEAQPSCRLPVSAATGKKITTLEGLAHKNGKLHVVQEAFITEQAAQCGYCLNGLIMGSVALLNKNSAPSTAEIKTALEKNICRCGVHTRAIKAVKRAASQKNQD